MLSALTKKEKKQTNNVGLSWNQRLFQRAVSPPCPVAWFGSQVCNVFVHLQSDTCCLLSYQSNLANSMIQ